MRFSNTPDKHARRCTLMTWQLQSAQTEAEIRVSGNAKNHAAAELCCQRARV